MYLKADIQNKHTTNKCDRSHNPLGGGRSDGCSLFGLKKLNVSVLEMCMGMGFPMGPGIPWESHGNGNKSKMGMGMGGNGN